MDEFIVLLGIPVGLEPRCRPLALGRHRNSLKLAGPVIAENLIRAENTAVTPIDEIIKFQDESRFHRIAHALCLHVSNPYGPPGRDCGSTPPDRRAPTQRAEASAPQAI